MWGHKDPHIVPQPKALCSHVEFCVKLGGHSRKGKDLSQTHIQLLHEQ